VCAPLFVIVFVCILPEKAVPEMTYTVSCGLLNPTLSLTHFFLDSSIDSIMRLMTVWRKTGKIIRIVIFRYICTIIISSSYNFWFPSFFWCFVFILIINMKSHVGF